MNKKRALFVDDELMILKGLQRILHPLKKDWDLIFADSAGKALEVMAEQTIDVLVSDMRMPGMNGLELLREVQRQYPATVRVMLTGQPDKNMYCEVLKVCHYFLWKPAQSKDLLTLFNDFRDLDAYLHDEKLLALVGGMSALPSPPKLYTTLTELMHSDTAGSAEVAALIREDMAMAAQVLKLVNSSYFGPPRQLESLEDAVGYLGLELLRQLVLVHHLFSGCLSFEVCKFDIDQLWQHSLYTARLAKAIARNNGETMYLQDSAYLAGLLHDIGKLVLITHLPKEYGEIQKMAELGHNRLECEVEILGTHHALIGGYLSSLWGLPHTISQMITFHHHDLSLMGKGQLLPVAEAVWHADRISKGDISHSEKYHHQIAQWQSPIDSV